MGTNNKDAGTGSRDEMIAGGLDLAKEQVRDHAKECLKRSINDWLRWGRRHSNGRRVQKKSHAKQRFQFSF